MYAVTFKYLDKFPVAGWIDENNNVVKVTTWFKSPMVGDEYVETRYARYRDYNGFRFGPQIHQSIGVPPDPSYDFDASTVEINVAERGRAGAGGGSPVWREHSVIQTRQLAPGTWLIGGNGYNSVALEFANFSAVIEAPLDEARSQAVIAETHRLIPNKPLRYVVNTHHHFDIAGGLRGYAAEDALIVTQQANYDNYEALALSLHSQQIDPDAQARAPRQVHYIRMEEHWTMTDGQRKLEVYHVQDQDHSDDMLMAYLPAEKILFETDLFDAPRRANTPASSLNMALLYNMERVRIAPEKIVSMRSGEIPIADFLRAVGVNRIVPRGQGLDAQLMICDRRAGWRQFQSEQVVQEIRASHRVPAWLRPVAPHCGLQKADPFRPAMSITPPNPPIGLQLKSIRTTRAPVWGSPTETARPMGSAPANMPRLRPLSNVATTLSQSISGVMRGQADLIAAEIPVFGLRGRNTREHNRSDTFQGSKGRCLIRPEAAQRRPQRRL